MKDKDREVLPSMNGDADLPERLWLYDDFTPDQDPAVTDYAAGLASLGFIGAAVRRRIRTWCAIGLAGLVLGLAYFVASPPAYSASTTVLLTHSINDNPTDAMSTDLTLAHSATVATRAMRQLKLTGSVSTFLADTTVDNLTDRVLQVTVKANSAAAATDGATAVAAAFLKVRAAQLQTQQQLTDIALQQQITTAQQHVTSLSNQVDNLSDSASHSTKTKLQNQLSEAQTALQIQKQNNLGQEASNASNVTAQIKGSQVLDPATAQHHSAAKFAIIYALLGLVLGVFIGLAIVIIGALVSDRLRRRDDVADALGTSVNLSVGLINGLASRLSTRRGRAVQRTDMQRIVAHLRDAIPDRESDGAAALGLVAVDNDKTAAQALVATAVACALDGEHVIVADLCPGAPAAHLLKATGSGVQAVSAEGAQLVVAVPDRDDVIPVGPVRHFRPEPKPGPDNQAETKSSDRGALAAAYRDADVLFTLVSLDPGLGADHLRTWAGDTVVMVTAGQSSWMRIHSVGEMIRLARIPLVSAILAGADRTDESMGLTKAAARGTQAARANGL
ncbi:MAG TPA: Wzz/FepE/Etk N-terminal domain-containing protein [Streptosporangiaceae bacterium]